MGSDVYKYGCLLPKTSPDTQGLAFQSLKFLFLSLLSLVKKELSVILAPGTMLKH